MSNNNALHWSWFFLKVALIHVVTHPLDSARNVASHIRDRRSRHDAMRNGSI